MTAERPALYAHPDLHEHLVGADPSGALVMWPMTPGGWRKRTVYAGPMRGPRGLKGREVELKIAAGTGWPGANRLGGGRRAGAGGKRDQTRSVKLTQSEFEAQAASAKAAGKPWATWAHDALVVAATTKNHGQENPK